MNGMNFNSKAIFKDDDIFVAEYDSTTYAAVKSAFDSGRTIICKHVNSQNDEDYYMLSNFHVTDNIGYFVFFRTGNTSTAVVSENLFLSSSTGWSYDYKDIVTTGGTQVTMNVWSFETALVDSAIVGNSIAG